MHDDGKRNGFASLVLASLICLLWGNGYAQGVTGSITASPPSDGSCRATVRGMQTRYRGNSL